MNLDDLSLYRRLDADDMQGHLCSFPETCVRAWQEGLAADLPTGYHDFDKIVVLGIGGSAIGADLLSALAVRESLIPVFVHRQYDLPAFVSSATLVIASSYSGETEETLTAFQQAVEKPGRVLVITTGGRLQALAEQYHVPVLRFQYKGQPRAAVGYSFMLLLAIAQRVGLFPGPKDSDVGEAATLLSMLRDDLRPEVPERANRGKQLARWLYGRVPLIYGAEYLAAVARRWKTQFNENAKTLAFSEELPEANHNFIEGLNLPSAALPLLSAVFLRAPSLHPRNLLRSERTQQLFEEAGIECVDVGGIGSRPLAQMLSVLYLGDWVSYYLAILNSVDPTPTPQLTAFKRHMAAQQFT